MPSLITGYSCDIFISYRQNDNRTGWVTRFVEDLEAELATAIKEPVSVYFDKNPHHGLMETHSVDKSLNEKLRCLIFIPILSQTYCDPKSFAWQHEFVPFVKMASEEGDVTLPNGNIASRLLPVKIHELDAQDKSLLEKELGGVLRAVDFTFRTAGVNRPLQPHEEHGNENLNKTTYTDQINKLANAIKELLLGIRAPKGAVKERTIRDPSPWFESSVKKKSKNRIAIASSLALAAALAAFLFYYAAFSGSGNVDRKSIAVLPFKNISNDAEQEFFTIGITEDILNHLTKIADLRVKASQSSFGYAGSDQPLSEIGEELDVASILTGSIQRNGDNVRITARLVDVETSEQMWSENYDRRIDNVLQVQSDIAREIAHYLKARLTSAESNSIQRPVSSNIDAYEYYLRARSGFSLEPTRADFTMRLRYLDKALSLDPGFATAYALKGWTWYAGSRFGFPTRVWLDSSRYFAEMAIDTDPQNAAGYLLRYQLRRFDPASDVNKDVADLDLAFRYAPNNTDILWHLGRAYLMNNNEEGAELQVRYARLRFVENDLDYCLYWAYNFNYIGDFPKADTLIKKAAELYPRSPQVFIQVAQLEQSRANYQRAISAALKAESLLEAAGAQPLEFASVYTSISESLSQAGKTDSAILYFSKFRDVELTFEDSTQFIPYRHRLGYLYWSKGDKQRALTLFRGQMHRDSLIISGHGSIGAWGDMTFAYYDLAIVHAFLGNDEEAMQCFEQVYKRGIQTWMIEHVGKDLLLKDFRGNPKFAAFHRRLERDYEFRVSALRRAINLSDASEELRTIAR
jgi:TolB-like protein